MGPSNCVGNDASRRACVGHRNATECVEFERAKRVPLAAALSLVNGDRDNAIHICDHHWHGRVSVGIRRPDELYLECAGFGHHPRDALRGLAAA